MTNNWKFKLDEYQSANQQFTGRTKVLWLYNKDQSLWDEYSRTNFVSQITFEQKKFGAQPAKKVCQVTDSKFSLIQDPKI